MNYLESPSHLLCVTGPLSLWALTPLCIQVSAGKLDLTPCTSGLHIGLEVGEPQPLGSSQAEKRGGFEPAGAIDNAGEEFSGEAAICHRIT